MTITVNGGELEIDDGTTVARLLEIRKVKMPEMVSVDVNGSILDRKVFGETTLRTGDAVEFLYFMGGGGA